MKTMNYQLKNIQRIVLSAISIIVICFGFLSQATLATTISNREIEEMNQLAGTYPFELIYEENGQRVTKIIWVTVLHQNSQVSTTNEEGIDAQDAEVVKGTMDTITNEQLIQITNARAWSLENGEPRAIEKVLIQKISDEKYHIEFQTAKGTAVQVSLFEREIVYQQNLEKYFPNDGMVSFSQFQKNILLVIIIFGLLMMLTFFVGFIRFYLLSRTVYAVLYEKIDEKNESRV